MAGELCGHGPLRILLTNDDGYQSPGIRALYDALRGAGHDVTLVAPASNMSGASASLTMSELTVSSEAGDAHIHAVNATPATSVLLAVNAPIVTARPDLVVSGINAGANAGAALPFSGTVGAVIAGARLLDPPIPGIAVSAARLTPGAANAGKSAARLHAIATRFVRLLETLRPAFCAGDPTDRGAPVLNVNFPAIDVDDVKGVRATVPDARADVALAFKPDAAGHYTTAVSQAQSGSQSADTDISWLARGYVTVTPLTSTYTTPASVESRTRALLDSID